jgi:SMODS and SLOG-associating 2TM effector domain family 4
LTRWRISLSKTMNIARSPTCITTSCVAISLTGWQHRTKNRNIGKLREAVHMFTERGFFSTRRSAATTLRLRPSHMKSPTPNANGRPNKNGEKSLEPHTQTDDTPQSRSILEGQLRESYGRVVYSHITHEKCADILLSKLSGIRFWPILLSALTTAGFIGGVFGAGKIAAVLGLCISTGLLALNAYTKNYDLGELAQKHSRRQTICGPSGRRICRFLWTSA